MSETRLHRLFNRARLDDRQINELIGLAHGIIADGIVNQAEAEYLFKWIVANATLTDNPVVRLLYERVDRILADGILDSEEAADLLDDLSRFCAGDFEIGEVQKASTLPLCEPAPTLTFSGSSFCLTGTFAFGSRKDCQSAVIKLGGVPGSLTQKTTYLVIGSYTTESWAHSSYGRKIEKAVDMRSNGIPISIIAEEHWVGQMRL
ncbi:BRCT domain-containing protein [Microvirga sp. ACRRW]|uniref:BRCT domain-containing protein n=1 Tax=Microvirga sp. ACRRW TaxID=2918205 RepID=UPI001EF6E59C|nr:BRCT domain-containing protein [Microvirga sp. ACRRW]MCG7392656.1 BRCT domain-containing protein [Microvirga sp. ACRRW]